MRRREIPASHVATSEERESAVSDAPRRVSFGEAFVAVDVTSRAPLYAQVIAQMEEALRRRVLQSGDLLPTERQLCEGFGVARSTLRRAMGDIEARGLISRTQGSGTRVEGAAAIQHHPETSHTLFELIAASKREPSTDVREFSWTHADADVSSVTGFPIGARLLHIVRDRYASGVPIASFENYVRPDAVVFDEETLTRGSIEAEFAGNGWAADRIEYKLTAVVLDDVLAGSLQMPAGTPALREHRRSYRGGVYYNIGINTYHPINHSITGVVDGMDPARG